MKKHDCLIEILTEELPPKALLTLRDSFANSICDAFNKAGLSFDNCERFATPRRLALLITQLDERQTDQTIDRKGPAVSAAFKENGEPTPAALGFAQSCGIDIKQAERLKTDKGEWLFYQVKKAGENTADLLPTIIETALKKLPIPKLMTWGTGEYHFVRPIKNILALLGENCIPMTLFGLKSTTETVGHRFHHPKTLQIKSPKTYQKQLRDAFVIVNFEERRDEIISHINGLAEKSKADLVANNALLDEVTALVEWPNALLGSFDKRYLAVPEEVLILSMATHQRYFALRDKQGQLLPNFIVVSNIQSRDPARIVAGNQKVLHARFSDALFFFNQDKKRTLNARLKDLKNVIFQKQLGTVFDKTQRVARIATTLAEMMSLDAKLAHDTAMLCKCDLMTDMVGEFPELQGTMGRYYALNDGLNETAAKALEAYYQPRFANDTIDNNSLAHCIAIADRIDTIVGIIGIGKLPTGDKDPFALRRQALGILRIILEYDYPFNLVDLIDFTVPLFGERLSNELCAVECLAFIKERLRQWCLSRGFNVDEVNAIEHLGLSTPRDIIWRLQSLQKIASHKNFKALVASNKRVANILKKATVSETPIINEAFLQNPAEKTLFDQLTEIKPEADSAIQAGDFIKAFEILSQLSDTIDNFFNNVMVMVDNDALKNNRINLLATLRQCFLSIADLSELQCA